MSDDMVGQTGTELGKPSLASRSVRGEPSYKATKEREAGRVADEGGNAPDVIRKSVDWIERWKYESKIIVGSIRSVGDVLSAATAGAHIITIPPQFLTKMVDHKYTRETVRQFVSDAQKALEMMQRV